MSESLRRRTLLSAVAGALAGGGFVAAGTGDASAAVTLEELSVGDSEQSVRGGVGDVRVTCDVGYRWDVPAHGAAPEIWQVRLLVDGDEIAAADGRSYNRTSSGTATVSGSVLDAEGFAASDFAPTAGGTTVEIPLTVELEVLGGSETVASAAQSATGSVTVTQAGYDASLHGSVGGRAEFVVESE